MAFVVLQGSIFFTGRDFWMSNILVLGVGPLPFESSTRLHAPGIRTWQIASALAARRHFVTLCIIQFGDFKPGEKPGSTPAVREDLGSNISLIKMIYSPKETSDAIRTLHIATRFTAVISTTDIMNGLAVDLDLKLPLWLDYNGDPFAEKQLQALRYAHDGSLLPQWNLYLKGLLAGDRFSVCSNAQRHAMLGQLAFAGRLTKHNSGEELVHVIPNCSRVMSERTPSRTKPLKSNRIPATSFLVLWSGGYNTWCDPLALFHGLEKAMKNNPSIFFATTGGSLEGHDTRSFDAFKELVEASALRDRFLFLGWIPTEEVGSYYEQADLAIFVDRYSVEGELGARTRIVDWVQYDLPIACTILCDMTRQMDARGLIIPIELNNSDSVAEAVLWAAGHHGELQDKASKAKAWFDSEWEEKKLLSPMLSWAENPHLSGDHNQESKMSRLSRIHLNSNAEGISQQGSERSPSEQKEGRSGLKDRLKSVFGRK